MEEEDIIPLSFQRDSVWKSAGSAVHCVILAWLTFGDL